MNRRTTWTLTVFGLAILALAWFATRMGDPQAVAQFESPVAALAFIGLAALGIERILELLWTILGGTLGTYWPLIKVNEAMKGLEDELSTALQPFQEKALAAVDQVVQKKADLGTSVEEAKKEIRRLTAQVNELQQLVPDAQRAQLMAAASAQRVKYLRERYKGHVAASKRPPMSPRARSMGCRRSWPASRTTRDADSSACSLALRSAC